MNYHDPDDDRATLEDVALALGVSGPTARLIELRALRKCYAWLSHHGLRAEDVLPDAGGRMTND
jgi:DNA-directed RNA polymerase sigma subunit (sigma70/sigma32)